MHLRRRVGGRGLPSPERLVEGRGGVVVLSGVLLERDDVPSVGAGEVEGVGVLAGGVRGEEREDGLGVGPRGSRAIIVVVFLAREECGPRARRVRGGKHVLGVGPSQIFSRMITRIKLN